MKKETKTKMRAVLYAEFDQDQMIDQETLDKEYGGDLTKVMKSMFEYDHIGIFDEVTFSHIEPLPTNKQ